MGKISEAQAILRAIGMPERQQTPICALSLLALAHIRPDDGECKIVCVNRYCMNLLYAPYWGKQR